MKNSTKSNIDGYSQIGSHLESKENIDRSKVLTPIRIVDYSREEERRVLSDYTVKSFNSQENEAKLVFKTDVKPYKKAK